MIFLINTFPCTNRIAFASIFAVGTPNVLVQTNIKGFSSVTNDRYLLILQSCGREDLYPILSEGALTLAIILPAVFAVIKTSLQKPIISSFLCMIYIYEYIYRYLNT